MVLERHADASGGQDSLTTAVATTVPPSRVLGIDPAAPYVALARSQQSSASISFEVGDAQEMPDVIGADQCQSAARPPRPSSACRPVLRR